MNPFSIEQKRIELLNVIPLIHGRTKLWTLCEFYHYLLSNSNTSFVEAYSIEFIEDLIIELNNYNPFFSDPIKSQKLIFVLQSISKIKSLEAFNEKLILIIKNIKSNLEVLIEILHGQKSGSISRITFPLIEEFDNYKPEMQNGILETITVKITKRKENNSFIFIPSMHSIDEKLSNQASISLNLAIKYLSVYGNKFNTFHEVIIFFENRYAVYQGNSLGVALTIAFIEELTKYYNLPYLINIKENISLTGGLDPNGFILPISSELIKTKIDTIFYSPIESFIIPSQDYQAAQNQLILLKKKFPNRNLNLIAITSLNDLLDRRSIIEIKKQKIIFRAANGIRKNWLAFSLITIIALMLLFVFIKDWDNNPYLIDLKGNELLVKNKLGKLLWSLPTNYNESSNQVFKDDRFMVININNDGTNEVIVSYEAKSISKNQYGRIACYDSNGNLLWSFSLKEKLLTKINSFSPNFTLQLLDTTTRNGIRELYLNASHSSSEFPSAICRINVKTGKQIPGVLVNAGRFNNSKIYIDSISKKQFIITGFYNNGFNQMGLLKIDLDNLDGQTPSDQVHYFLNKSKAKLNELILFPNTDYNQLVIHDHSNPIDKAVQNDEARKRIVYTLLEGLEGSNTSIAYEFTYDFKNIEIITSSSFEKARDSLVVRNLLNPPKTYTKEFQEILKRKIVYWDGNTFKNWSNKNRN